MNLFEIFVNFRNRKDNSKWAVTTATFTGKYHMAAKHHSKAGYYTAEYGEYEIRYEANGELRKGWYTFYPVPDPLPEEIKGQKMMIRYHKKKPYIFEHAEDF